jgi:hypothetical protein
MPISTRKTARFTSGKFGDQNDFHEVSMEIECGGLNDFLNAIQTLAMRRAQDSTTRNNRQLPVAKFGFGDARRKAQEIIKRVDALHRPCAR